MDGDSDTDRLQLFEPVCEDWHGLMCLMKVRVYSRRRNTRVSITNTIHMQGIWKLMFKSSSKDHGMLWHLSSLLGRLLSVKGPKKDMNACYFHATMLQLHVKNWGLKM